MGDEGFTFVVQGRAAPQGSKALHTKADGSKYMKESSDRVHPWRKKIMQATKGADGRPLATFEGPVCIDIEFEFVKPKSNQDDYPTARNIGDGDKLTRAVWDALTAAKVIQDDAFCVTWSGSKHWGPEDRAFITVRQAPPLHMRPIGIAVTHEIIDEVRSQPTSSIVDFAQAIGVELTPWQKLVAEKMGVPEGEVRIVPTRSCPDCGTPTDGGDCPVQTYYGTC